MRIKILVLTLLLGLSLSRPAGAFWVWTPESGQWTNPKFSVKDTPQDQLKYSVGIFETKDYKKAQQEFEKLIKNFPRAREAAEAQYYLGRCLEETGQIFAAFKAYQIVIDKYPFSERSAEVVKRQYEIGNAMLEGKEKRNKVINVIVGGDSDVIDVFRAVIKNAPYGEYAAPSQYKIGLYLQQKELYQEARDEFEKTMNDYPDSEWARAARFQIAVSDSKRSSHAEYDQKVTGSAVNEFQDFLKEYPEAELSAQAKKHIDKLREKEAENIFLTGKFYEKQHQSESAKIYYTTIVDSYKNTSWAPKALERLQKLK